VTNFGDFIIASHPAAKIRRNPPRERAELQVERRLFEDVHLSPRLSRAARSTATRERERERDREREREREL